MLIQINNHLKKSCIEKMKKGQEMVNCFYDNNSLFDNGTVICF